MGLFVYTQKGSIISMVDLPTTKIIEPSNSHCQLAVFCLLKGGGNLLTDVELKRIRLELGFTQRKMATMIGYRVLLRSFLISCIYCKM